MFPVNLLGDFAAGGMLCALGITIALIERSRSGRGQVIDSAMVDGASYLNHFICQQYAMGLWNLERGTNMLDSGSHFYEVYRTKDNQYLSVGAIEPQFYRNLLKGLDIDPSTIPAQYDRSTWPLMKEKFQKVFASKTRDEWCAIFDGTDACVAPIIGLNELMNHPHSQARMLYYKDIEGKWMPAAAPRLSRTPARIPTREPYMEPGENSMEVLLRYGFSQEDINRFLLVGAISAKKSSTEISGIRASL